jgi:hypothetical protein
MNGFQPMFSFRSFLIERIGYRNWLHAVFSVGERVPEKCKICLQWVQEPGVEPWVSTMPFSMA